MEKIKDILSEMLEVADAENGILAIHAPTFASRIEAAWEIQLAAEKARAAGEGYAAGKQAVTNCNQLKMREALELVSLYISNGPEEESRAYVKNGQIEMLFALEVLDTISAALSATPRNCDMFSDETEAQLKFLNDVWLVSSDKESMLERHRIENWTEEMLLRYARWLLAPVKKNENDE